MTYSQRPMQKQRNGSVRYEHTTYQRQYPVQLPEQLIIDDIAMMSDEELTSQVRTLEKDREVVLDARLDPRPWEEEVAYIRREQQIRRYRRDAHFNWMSSQTTDVDNIQFNAVSTAELN